MFGDMGNAGIKYLLEQYEDSVGQVGGSLWWLVFPRTRFI